VTAYAQYPTMKRSRRGAFRCPASARLDRGLDDGFL